MNNQYKDLISMEKSKRKGWAAVFLSVALIAVAVLSLYIIGRF